MTGIPRRRTLYLMSAGIAALAGCSGSSDEPNGSDADDTEDESTEDESTEEESIEDPSDDGADDAEETDEYEGTIETGEIPSYASLLPDLNRSDYFYGAIDIETMTALFEDEDVQSGEEPTDPLVVNPVVVALLSSYGLTVLSRSHAANAYGSHDETPSGEAEMVYVNGIYAIRGEYDRDGLETTLEEDGYVRQDDGNAYAIYAHEETGDVVGVTGEVFAFPDPNAGGSAFDPAAMIRRILETAVGQREPKHATDDAFEWLLRAGRNDGITTGIYTEAEAFDSAYLGTDQSNDESGDLESEYDAFEGAYGAQQHLALADDDGAHAGAVVTYVDEDSVDIDRLESSLGTEADSVDLTRDGTAVSVDAEYSGDL